MCYNRSMKLVVGLGNPGNRYNFTRHNTGFLALDFYFKVNNVKWSEKPRMGALWGRSDDVIFIKPQEFYNDSGLVVANYANYYKIPASDILVICDNFDLEFGKVRYRSSGQAAGNNGLKSIDEALKTSDYPRIRVGTGNDSLRRKIGDIEFVLSKFTPEEKEKLPGVLTEISEKINENV